MSEYATNYTPATRAVFQYSTDMIAPNNADGKGVLTGGKNPNGNGGFCVLQVSRADGGRDGGELNFQITQDVKTDFLSQEVVFFGDRLEKDLVYGKTTYVFQWEKSPVIHIERDGVDAEIVLCGGRAQGRLMDGLYKMPLFGYADAFKNVLSFAVDNHSDALKKLTMKLQSGRRGFTVSKTGDKILVDGTRRIFAPVPIRFSRRFEFPTAKYWLKFPELEKNMGADSDAEGYLDKAFKFAALAAMDKYIFNLRRTNGKGI